MQQDSILTTTEHGSLFTTIEHVGLKIFDTLAWTVTNKKYKASLRLNFEFNATKYLIFLKQINSFTILVTIQGFTMLLFVT